MSPELTEFRLKRDDVEYMIGELRHVFEDVLDSTDCPDEAVRDVCVLTALKRLRTVQLMLSGGAL